MPRGLHFFFFAIIFVNAPTLVGFPDPAATRLLGTEGPQHCGAVRRKQARPALFPLFPRLLSLHHGFSPFPSKTLVIAPSAFRTFQEYS